MSTFQDFSSVFSGPKKSTLVDKTMWRDKFKVCPAIALMRLAYREGVSTLSYYCLIIIDKA